MRGRSPAFSLYQSLWTMDNNSRRLVVATAATATLLAATLLITALVAAATLLVLALAVTALTVATLTVLALAIAVLALAVLDALDFKFALAVAVLVLNPINRQALANLSVLERGVVAGIDVLVV